MNKISVVISAHNEEKKIEGCLKSIEWADEIILVDNSSTDKTAQIARRYTAKIFEQKNNPLAIDLQKNFGFSKANNDWILSLDADERVTPELAKEIQLAIKQPNNEITGYYIPRKNIIFGKWIEHTGWYPDHQLRLFRKGKGEFVKKHVHEMLEVKGEADYLSQHLLHYNYETIHQFLERHISLYAPNEAEERIQKGYVFDYLDAIRFPLREFLSRFFARGGYKDGLHGLILSLFMAFYHLLIFTLVWEKQKFKEVEVENILGETEKEFKKSYKEMMSWFLNEKVKQTNSFLGRFWLKTKLKLF